MIVVLVMMIVVLEMIVLHVSENMAMIYKELIFIDKIIWYNNIECIDIVV